MIYVIDASVAMKWFVAEDMRPQARTLSKYADHLEAPDLILPEIANIAWKKILRGEITYPQAQFIASALPDYLAKLHSSVALVEQALELAFDLNHPVYDCIYLTCAIITDGTLITADRRLCGTVKDTDYGHLVTYLGDL